jgi:mono/diheme cytochrome c family protein
MKILAVLFCGGVYALTSLANNNDELTKSIARGKELYTETCVTCHLANGKGVEKTFPPLAKADFLLKFTEKSIHAIKYGMRGPVTVNGVVYDNAMPPSTLEDDEIADVMNYIRNAFGNENKQLITPKMVADVKE